jgi:hypothetical protein
MCVDTTMLKVLELENMSFSSYVQAASTGYIQKYGASETMMGRKPFQGKRTLPHHSLRLYPNSNTSVAVQVLQLLYKSRVYHHFSPSGKTALSVGVVGWRSK